MKNFVRMVMLSAVLLTVGTGAVFAQQPTMDKITLTLINDSKAYRAELDHAKSGAAVFPATHNNLPVTAIMIDNLHQFTSITIPAGPAIYNNVGFGCGRLTSVTFQGSDTKIQKGAFDGDLHIAYQANGAGTYTRPAGGKTWTKQGGYAPPPPPPPERDNGGKNQGNALDGVWYSQGRATVTIRGNVGVWTDFGPLGGAWQDAANKGLLRIGDVGWRDITSTGNLTWSGQQVWVLANGNNATGIAWKDRAWTLSGDGRTLTMREGNRNLETFTRRQSPPPPPPERDNFGGKNQGNALNGVWAADGSSTWITISGNIGIFSALGTNNKALTQSAIDNGYIKLGDTKWRNITKTGDLKWSGQNLSIKWDRPNVASGTVWTDCSFILSADGQTLTFVGTKTEGGTTTAVADTYTRKQ